MSAEVSKVLAHGFAFFGGGCNFRPLGEEAQAACWDGNREENKSAPDRHVSDATLGQATPFKPLSDLLCMVNSGETRKRPSRAQCKFLNHTQKIVIVSILLNSGLLCYMVVNT